MDSLRGAAEGLRDEEGALDSVCVTAAVDSLREAREGFRSGAASEASAAGVDALRGAVEGLRVVEGAGDTADLAVGVEALLGAKDGLRSGAALLGLAAGVDVLGGAWGGFGFCEGVEAASLCFGGGLDESFFGWVAVGLASPEAGLGASFLGRVVVDLAGVLAGLVVGVEDLEGAVVGFFGRVVCLFAVEGGLVFLGGSLGIFFFCSGIVQ